MARASDSRGAKALPASAAAGVACFNQAKIEMLRESLPPDEALGDATTWLKAMAHPGRLAILHLLSVEACCVCDLANALRQPVSTVSQGLRQLRRAGLVGSKQDGKFIVYSLTTAGRRHVRQAGLATSVASI